MPRVHFVKKARKDNPVVKKGESYYWWQFAFSPRSYSKTKPTRSQLTKSSFLSQLYDLEDQIGNGSGQWTDFESIQSNIDELVDQLQSLADECQDSLDNMPEQLQESSQAGETLQERIDALEETISCIESYDVPELPENWADEVDEWDEMDKDAREEYINEWKQEQGDEFLTYVTDNWPQL